MTGYSCQTALVGTDGYEEWASSIERHSGQLDI